MNYISDAHALLWHLYWPQRLGEAAHQVFSAADAGEGIICIPAVVVAEVIIFGTHMQNWTCEFPVIQSEVKSNCIPCPLYIQPNQQVYEQQ